jgi:hypothetical protein
MAQPNSGIGNVTANTGLVEMAMAYSRSRVICAAARLGVADALGDEVCSVGFMAECQAHANALYCLLRALASIGVTEETASGHFRMTPFGKPLRRDVPESVWSAVIFWADLLADDWFLLTAVGTANITFNTPTAHPPSFQCPSGDHYVSAGAHADVAVGKRWPDQHGSLDRRDGHGLCVDIFGARERSCSADYLRKLHKLAANVPATPGVFPITVVHHAADGQRRNAGGAERHACGDGHQL